MNFYQFTLYAIDVAEIPTDEIDEDSGLIDVRNAFGGASRPAFARLAISRRGRMLEAIRSPAKW